jgi:hypothetical protein
MVYVFPNSYFRHKPKSFKVQYSITMKRRRFSNHALYISGHYWTANLNSAGYPRVSSHTAIPPRSKGIWLSYRTVHNPGRSCFAEETSWDVRDPVSLISVLRSSLDSLVLLGSSLRNTFTKVDNPFLGTILFLFLFLSPPRLSHSNREWICVIGIGCGCLLVAVSNKKKQWFFIAEETP